MFTKMGLIVAWFLFVGGVAQVIIGLIGAFSGDPAAFAAVFYTSGTTGDAIDEGTFYIGVGIAFGILVEISKGISKK